MNRLRACVLVTIVGCVLMVPGSAHATDIVVPLDTVIASGIADGERVELALVSSNDLDGENCVVRAVHGGRGAPHPGNDLVVTSGPNSVTLVDVEREPDAISEGSSEITLGPTITVELVMGPDQHFDGDIDLEFRCGRQVVAFGATVERSGDSGGGALPLTGGQIVVTLTIGAGLIAAAATLMSIARRRPMPPHTPSGT